MSCGEVVFSSPLPGAELRSALSFCSLCSLCSLCSFVCIPCCTRAVFRAVFRGVLALMSVKVSVIIDNVNKRCGLAYCVVYHFPFFKGCKILVDGSLIPLPARGEVPLTP